MLRKYGAPRQIDYLSIDTEGSEFDILQAFDFGEYEFGIITCEHNYTPQREKIHDLLVANGYVRVWEKVSRFDDWYIRT
ncbi:FkbM family methyltransferase [Neorhizobium sp. SOG26]|uniref:FkbM family methyltransferase n=1 Tax=Neorhizobium sp. SOG26 TaxID=2060726 RepID=UPI001902892B|nr:FkbM family methyltransferase [Neorhizobium sp. SOG26]